MTPKTMERRYYTITDLAHLLGISERTVRRGVSDGRLPRPLKINRCVRFPVDAVREYLDAACA